MAELGLLSGRRCAVHFAVEEAFRAAYPDVITITDLPMIQDGPFLTCPGGLQSINVAMALIEEHCGRNRVQKALDYVLADWHPDMAHTDLQGPNVADLRALDKRLAQAVMLMRQRPFESLSLSEIALKVGTSKRELTRLFQRHLRQPPGAFRREMRLSSAHWMVVNTDRSITDIALECGFNDSSHLIRNFKTRYGATPANVRRVKGRLSVL